MKLFLFMILCFAGFCDQDSDMEKLFQKENLSFAEARQLIRYFREKKAEDFFLIDVRTPEEFAGGHVSGAINIPLEQNAFTAMINNQLYRADANYILYCLRGNRSRMFMELLKECGFCRLAHIKDGIINKSAKELAIDSAENECSHP